MKDKNLKIIFFTIIIVLIFVAIYLITINKEIVASDIKITKKENKISEEITLGITNFDTLNPILSNSQDMQYISKLIYEPLIDIGQAFELKQGLAIEWNKLNNKTYIIRLDENKFWNNGEKFTAKDVKYTIDYIKSNESIYKENVKNIEKIEIIDDFTIKIFLTETEEKFEYMLCFPIICDKNNIGTGMFYIDEIGNEQIVLKSKTSKKNININIYENITKLYNAFSQGKVDLMVTNNINFESYIGTFGYNKKIICNRNFEFLKLNIKETEIVQALNFAINKSEIVYKLYNNLYSKAEFPLQYGSYLYNENIEYEYSTQQAKQILKNAGWEYNRDGLEEKWADFEIGNYCKSR